MISRKKKALLDLEKYLNKAVVVRLLGGREMRGILKGFDSNMNLVLNSSAEAVRDPKDFTRPLRGEQNGAEVMRELGAVVCKGASVMVVMPQDGMAEIDNPFLAGEE